MAQPRPPSPGNIRPVRNEHKSENEKKEIQQEPEKATDEKTDNVEATSISKEAANEGCLNKPETMHGKASHLFLLWFNGLWSPFYYLI